MKKAKTVIFSILLLLAASFFLADAAFAYADTGAVARVTVELPEALQADKDYCVFYGIESFPEYIWGCTYVRAAAGAASF